jgi:excisionase family DNA binding protein
MNDGKQRNNKRFLVSKDAGNDNLTNESGSQIENGLTKDHGLFKNLIWLTTKEAAVYLRRSANAIYLLVSRGHLRARKFRNKLYFKRDELDYLIETSQLKGGR